VTKLIASLRRRAAAGRLRAHYHGCCGVHECLVRRTVLRSQNGVLYGFRPGCWGRS